MLLHLLKPVTLVCNALVLQHFPGSCLSNSLDQGVLFPNHISPLRKQFLRFLKYTYRIFFVKFNLIEKLEDLLRGWENTEGWIQSRNYKYKRYRKPLAQQWPTWRFVDPSLFCHHSDFHRPFCYALPSTASSGLCRTCLPGALRYLPAWNSSSHIPTQIQSFHLGRKVHNIVYVPYFSKKQIILPKNQLLGVLPKGILTWPMPEILT